MTRGVRTCVAVLLLVAACFLALPSTPCVCDRDAVACQLDFDLDEAVASAIALPRAIEVEHRHVAIEVHAPSPRIVRSVVALAPKTSPPA